MVKKLEDYEWICPEPFTNILTTTYGHFIPCCVLNYTAFYKKANVDDNHEDTYPAWLHNCKDSDICDVENHSLKDYHNTNVIKKMKKALKENNKNFLKDMCKTCIEQENANNKSSRQFYIERFNNEFKHKKSELEKIIHEETEPTFLHSVEANSIGGNICNLSCNMCSNGCSSKYDAESYKLNEVSSTFPKPMQSEKFLRYLETTEILEFKFTGGEPLLIKKNLDLMKKLNKKTIIRIITNGTVNPSELIKTLKDFEKVIINVSSEGPKDVTEYIRHGSNFDLVLKHYDMMQNVWGEDVMFTATVNALNIARIPELLKLRKGHAGSIVTSNEYCLNSIPDDIKEIHLQKLYEEGNIKLIKQLEKTNFIEEKMWKMLRHIKRRDRLRGTNLLDVFPEWKKYYETCNG